MRLSLRILAGVLVLAALVGDVFLMQQVLHHQNDFFLGGFVGIILSIALAVIASGDSFRAHVLAAAIALYAWLLAIIAGDMFASCDPAMRSAIVLMAAVVFSVPFVASGLVFVPVLLSIGAGWLGSRILQDPPSRWVYGVIVAASVIIAIASYLVATALGSRPTPTACVI